MSTAELLLVDDTPENLQVLASILRAEDYQVRLATSGAQALRSVATRRPDLVLLDLRMPDLDGIETCRRLRQDPAAGDMPILFLSASDAVEDRLAAFAAGGQDFITKPFQAAEVLARVSTHLQLARTRIQLARLNARLADRVVAETRRRTDAEETAADRQARLDLILEAADLGSWELDPATDRVRFDDRACRILGLTPPGPCSWRDLVAGLEAGPGRQTGLLEMEGWWTPPGGTGRRRIRLRGRPAGGAAGDTTVGMLWDISEEFRLREQLTRRDRLESIGLLAGGVAHDFNNQLAVIVAELDILDMMHARDEERVHLDGIAQAVAASTSLVRDLLNFARQREIVREAVDAAALVARATRLAGRTLGPGIAVTVPTATTPIWVHGEAAQLENTLLNLCINARDAMPDGGTLTVSLAIEEVGDERRCEICHEAFPGRWVAIRVADSGTGIPDAVRRRMFEPFFSTKGAGRGNGLGLASVAACLAMHGGHLTVDSTVGAGTTMTMFLPACPPPAARPADRTVRACCGRLLLLDDQASIRQAITDGLQRLGWTVEAHADPDAAIASWRAGRPRCDLALVDMSMPGMGGVEVFRALRASDPEAKVVLMSGHAGDRIGGLVAEGLAGFVEKPVKLRQLAQLLGSIIATERPS